MNVLIKYLIFGRFFFLETDRNVTFEHMRLQKTDRIVSLSFERYTRHRNVITKPNRLEMFFYFHEAVYCEIVVCEQSNTTRLINPYHYFEMSSNTRVRYKLFPVPLRYNIISFTLPQRRLVLVYIITCRQGLIRNKTLRTRFKISRTPLRLRLMQHHIIDPTHVECVRSIFFEFEHETIAAVRTWWRGGHAPEEHRCRRHRRRRDS